MRRCDSAAIVPKTKELLPEPETPVNTVSRRFGISMLMSLRLFTRTPCTRIRSWLSAACGAGDRGSVLVAVLIRVSILWGVDLYEVMAATEGRLSAAPGCGPGCPRGRGRRSHECHTAARPVP